MQEIGGDPREAARIDYISGLLEKSRLMAVKDGILVAKTNHLVYALVEELSEAYLVNNEMAETVGILCKEVDELKVLIGKGKQNEICIRKD